jgi:predicted RNA-binding Zn-ribbon protein involved in translation (DUF1610 family)
MPPSSKPDNKPADPAPTPSTAGPAPSPSAPELAPPPPAPEPAKDLTPDELLALLLCPDCGSDLVPYEGTGNPHKVGTAFCPKCGKRWKAI